MEKVTGFLTKIRENNNRQWFEANKDLYREAQAEFDAFTGELTGLIAAFDGEIAGLTVKDCTYRIYRDVRFSPNKEPYKTHMGAYVCRGGRKSGYSGYYFHVEPGNNLMSVGMYMPEPRVLRSMRDEIFDNGDELMAAAKRAGGFSIDMTNTLSRTPRGYPPGSKYDEYLRLRDFYLCRPFGDDYLSGPDLAARVAAEFKTAYDFNVLVNRAIEYAYEEM